MKQETKKATAIGIAGLIVGGFGGYGLLEPVTVTETVLVNDIAALEALEGQLGELQVELDAANSELDRYAEVIAEAVAEDAAEETAIEYMNAKDYKVQDWMNTYFEVRVDYFEDGDEGLDGKEYIKVFVEIRDGEAEEISFEEI